MKRKETTSKCDACGKFVSYADLVSGRASITLITPDSHYSCEEYETLCRNCLPLERKKALELVDGFRR